MLTKEELENLFLNAKLIHEFGDTSYFMKEINDIQTSVEALQATLSNNNNNNNNNNLSSSAVKKEAVVNLSEEKKEGEEEENNNNNLSPPLNFFIRFRVNNNNKYYVSRVVKVHFLSEISNNNNKNDDNNNNSTKKGLTIDTNFNHNNNNKEEDEIVLWRGKKFWIAIEVAPFTNDAEITIENNNNNNNKIIYLPQISSHLPTEKEMEHYAMAQLVMNPNAIYNNNNNNNKEDKEQQRKRLLRSYFPSTTQINEILKPIKEKKIKKHRWTAEEIQKTSALHAKYNSTSHSRTINNNNNDDNNNDNTVVDGVGWGATPMRNTLQKNEKYKLLTKWRIITTMAEGNNPQQLVQLSSRHNNNKGSQHSPHFSPPLTATNSHFEDASPFNNNSNNNSIAVSMGLSPFLPKKLLHQYNTQSLEWMNAVVATSQEEDNNNNNNNIIGETPSSSSQPFASQGSVDPFLSNVSSQNNNNNINNNNSNSIPSLEEVKRKTLQWSEENAAQEKKFYEYLKNSGRNDFLTKTVNITDKNKKLNRRHREEAMRREREEMENLKKRKLNNNNNNSVYANEKEERMSLSHDVENETALWITDDEKRIAFALEHKNAMEGGGGQAKKNTTNNNKAAAAAAKEKESGGDNNNNNNSEGEAQKKEESKEEKEIKDWLAIREAEPLNHIDKTITVTAEDCKLFMEEHVNALAAALVNNNNNKNNNNNNKFSLGKNRKQASPHLLEVSTISENNNNNNDHNNKTKRNIIKDHFVVKSALQGFKKRSRTEGE